MAYIVSGKEEAEYLKNYDASKYKTPSVAADTALFSVRDRALCLLLIRRGGYPYKDSWALPGGFVDYSEDIRAAAQRELAEETGISGLYLEQAFTWGQPGRDPRSRVITVSHIALADFSQLSPRAGDDASEAAWFAVEDYSQTKKDGRTFVRFTLRGPDTLRPVVSFPTGRIQEIISEQSSDLAFDHAESAALSIHLLRTRVRCPQFLAASLASPRLRRRARRLILSL